MKTKLNLTGFAGLILISSSISAHAVVYSTADFSNNPADYTLTRILNNSGGVNDLAPVFTGDQLSFTSTMHAGAADQYAFTLNGLSLAVGDEVNVDISFFKSTTGSGSEAFGLYVGQIPVAGVREDYVTSYLNSATAVKSRGFDGTTEFNNPTGSVAGITSLFISRDGASDFEAGYYVGATRTVLANRDGVNVGNDAAAVGFYIDSRGIGNIGAATVVPEPSAAFLGALGLLGLLRRRRR